MTIQLKDGVYWDTAAARQSAEAYAWMREEKLSHCTVTITREYVEPDSPSWAMKRDLIVVTPKSE